MRVTNVAQTVLNNIVSKMHILFGIQQFDNSQDAVIDGSVMNGTAKKLLNLNAFKVAMVFLLFIGANTGLRAQVSSYSFAQTSGTYTALASPTTVHASGWDDAIATVTIPFSFTFNNIAYTTASVNSNGYLTFGSTTSTATTGGAIASTAGYAGAVVAYGRDLISNASTIVSGVEGTSPNRVFVIQWNNARRYSSGGVAGDVLNFQIRLSEGSNTAALRYGTCTITSTTALTGQVGLRGAANTDYNNRTSSTAWASTTGGTANSNTVTTNSTITPASGLTFTYTPPAACVAPTNQATALIYGTTTGTSIAGSFTAATSSPSGYLVVRSTSSSLSSGPVDGTTYSAAGALGGGTVVQSSSAVSFTDSSLTGNTQYYYFVYSYNNTSCTGGPKYITTTPLSSSKITCPAAPTAPVASGQTSSGGTVSWTAPVGGIAGAITYTFETYTDAARTVAFGSAVTGLTSPTYTIASGLTPGTPYY